MNYYALSGLFNGVVSLIFGAMVLFHNPQSKKYQTFALLCFSIFFWGIFYSFWQTSTDAVNALLFCRLLMIGAILMPITHYHHVVEVFEINNPRRAKILIGGYLFAGALIALSFTGLITKGVSEKMIFPYWPDAGVLFGPLLIFKFSFATYAIFLLRSQSRRLVRPNRTSLNWVIVATVIAYISGSTNYPLWYGIPVWPILTPLVCVFLMTEAFFLFRLRLLDSYLFLRDTTIHVLSSLIMAAGFYIVSKVVPQRWKLEIVTFGMALSLPVLYPVLSAWVRKNLNRTRWGDVDRYLEDIEEKSGLIVGSSLTIASLSTSTLDLIHSIFPVDQVGIYFMRSKKGSLHLYARKGMEIAPVDIPRDSEIFNWFMNNRAVYSREDFEGRRKHVNGSFREYFGPIAVEVMSPIYVSHELAGLILLGPKLSGAHFHEKDLEAVRLISKKVEIACGYATTTEKYTVVMGEWSHSLNQITKPIEQKAEIIRDYYHLFPQEKIKAAADIILTRVTQLRKFHDYITNTTAITRELITGEFKKELVNIVDLIRDSVQKYKLENREIVSMDLPETNVQASISVTGIDRVITELLSNSLRHTAGKGAEAKIAISGSIEKDGFVVRINDNGDGVDSKDIEKIWEAGWQSKDMNSGAQGLGLSICKQTIEAHGGKVFASSPGKGQGMEIRFIIPIANSENGEKE